MLIRKLSCWPQRGGYLISQLQLVFAGYRSLAPCALEQISAVVEVTTSL